MDKESNYIKAVIAVAVIALVWLFLKNRGGPTIIPGGPVLNGFQAPYFYTNPGIPDDRRILNNGPSFNSTNTINVQTGQISGLTNTYMPMFGLVGMTAVAA